MERQAGIEAYLLREVEGVGDRGFKLLVDGFGGPQAVLTASAAELEARAHVSAELAARIAAAATRTAEAEEWWRRLSSKPVVAIAYGSTEYPDRLATLADPPALLYLAGDGAVLRCLCVAVVGSRRASTQGLRFTRRLTRDLAAAGVTVISGLAQGIDTAAHEGTLEAGGSAVAVFGSGLDRAYPARNRALAVEILRSGACVSEQPLGAEPRAHHFPRRNRIISGLSLGVVVVEAAADSGSLITAQLALEQGREVFAVPGLPGSHGTRGTHGLLRNGAKLVESAEDVLEELGAMNRPAPVTMTCRPRGEPPQHVAALWQCLEEGPLYLDELAAAAGVGAPAAAAQLMELVLLGHAEEWPGKRFSLPR